MLWSWTQVNVNLFTEVYVFSGEKYPAGPPPPRFLKPVGPVAQLDTAAVMHSSQI